MKTTPPKIFIHLDNPGIDSLFSQTHEKLPQEIQSSKELQGTGTVKGRVAFLKSISFMLGLGDISVDAELSGSARTGHTEKSTLTTENKLALLLSDLRSIDQDLVFDDLELAASSAIHRKEVVFFHGFDHFNAPQFYPGAQGAIQANEDSVMYLEIGLPPGVDFNSFIDNYDSDDNYYKNLQSSERTRLTMMASLEKFTRIGPGRQMGKTSHDAIFFRGHKGAKLPLNVFGCLVPYGEIFCQIKPYAIWI